MDLNKFKEWLDRNVWPFNTISKLRSMVNTLDREVAHQDNTIATLCKDLRLLRETLSKCGVSFQYHTPEGAKPIRIHWSAALDTLSISPYDEISMSITELKPEIHIQRNKSDTQFIMSRLRDLSPETKREIATDICDIFYDKFYEQFCDSVYEKVETFLEFYND